MPSMKKETSHFTISSSWSNVAKRGEDRQLFTLLFHLKLRAFPESSVIRVTFSLSTQFRDWIMVNTQQVLALMIKIEGEGQ